LGRRTYRLDVEVGVDTFIYWPADDRLRQIERFAAEVVPAVQKQVARYEANPENQKVAFKLSLILLPDRQVQQVEG
jgi:hypothetical protein